MGGTWIEGAVATHPVAVPSALYLPYPVSQDTPVIAEVIPYIPANPPQRPGQNLTMMNGASPK